MGARFIPLFGRHFRKTNNLDFLRFFFATIVIYCHCYILYYGTEDTVPVKRWMGFSLTMGEYQKLVTLLLPEDQG